MKLHCPTVSLLHVLEIHVVGSSQVLQHQNTQVFKDSTYQLTCLVFFQCAVQLRETRQTCLVWYLLSPCFVSFFCFLNTHHVSAFVGGAGESAVVFCGVSAAVSQTGHTDHGGAF